jgi:hypothetical protein
MEVRPRDVSLFLYNFGVTLAGGWVATRMNGLIDPLVIGVMILVAVGWTVYFRFSMVPRLAQLDARSQQRNSTEE